MSSGLPTQLLCKRGKEPHKWQRDSHRSDFLRCMWCGTRVAKSANYQADDRAVVTSVPAGNSGGESDEQPDRCGVTWVADGELHECLFRHVEGYHLCDCGARLIDGCICEQDADPSVGSYPPLPWCDVHGSENRS